MITIAQITMNAGDGIPGSVIKWNIKNNRKNFERFIVVDGAITPEAIEFYKQHNVEYVDSPWKDSYVDQYRAFASVLKKDEWCLYLDCDEIPSKELIEYVNHPEFNRDLESHKINMVLLPCILHITEDGSTFVPVEPSPKKEYVDQWTKRILFKKEESLDFNYFGSHVIGTHRNNERPTYVSAPYYHMKTLESFVVNDVWQAFLSPEGQQYGKAQAALFKVLIKPYKSVKEFKKSTNEGTWSPALVNFAIKNMNNYENPISRLAWTYFILNKHQAPDGVTIPKWEDIKQYILSKESMELLDKNKKMNNCIRVKV